MYFLLHMGYAPPMRQFNVGDKVRRLTPGIERMQPNTEWVVSAVEGTNYISVHGEPESGYMSSNFELVEPAEIEQATAILDTVTTEDGWWDIDLNIVNAQRVVDNAEPFGLEVRVQVRRVQS